MILEKKVYFFDISLFGTPFAEKNLKKFEDFWAEKKNSNFF